MKKIIFLLITASISYTCLSQQLIDIYKSGTVKMVPDPTYAQNNDWDVLFWDFFRKAYEVQVQVGNRKSMAIAGDGTVFIINHSNKYMYKFDENGDFLKKSERKKIGASGILDDRYLITHNSGTGLAHVYDLNGNFKKTIQFDFALPGCIPLKNNKIAIAGSVPWSTKSRKIVMIKDIETEEEKIIDSYFVDYNLSHIEFSNGKKYYFVGPMFSSGTKIAKSKEGNLILGNDHKQEIKIYSPEGELIKTFQLGITPIFIDEKTKEEYIKGMLSSLELIGFSIKVKENLISIVNQDFKLSKEDKDRLVKIINKEINFTKEDTGKLINIIEQESNIFTSRQKKQYIEGIRWKSSLSNEDKDRFREKIEEELYIPDPIVNTLPLYHTLKIDSDNNLLVFVYVDKERTIECKVYTLEGEYICDTKFVSDEYKIDISKFQFYDRYVYGLFPLKETEGIPLRLVRMKLIN